MEIERIYTCDSCKKESIYCKAWIKREIFYLCKQCHDIKKDQDENYINNAVIQKSNGEIVLKQNYK